MGLGRQLQAAAAGQIEPLDLGQGRDQARAAQRLLERPEARVPVPYPDHDQPLGRQAQLDQARREQIALGADPEHLPLLGEAAEEQGGEACRRHPLGRPPLGWPPTRTPAQTPTWTKQLVQTAAAEATAGQRLVDAGQPQWQDRTGRPPRHALDPGQPTAQPRQQPPLGRRIGGRRSGGRRVGGSRIAGRGWGG